MNRYRTAILCVLACGLAAFALAPRARAQQGDAVRAANQDIITTVAGGGPNDIPALNANLNLPWEVAVDKQGNYYVATGGGSSRVFKISPAGIITVVAGTGLYGYSGDDGPAVKRAGPPLI